MARAPLGGSGRAAMTELGWRSRSTLTTTFIIAAGTLAAAHYCSRLNHCATSPNSGSEHSWGISLTQDSRDSDFDSDCHSNMVAVGQMSVPSNASAHQVDSLQAMLDCSASLPSATAETGCLASHSAMLYCYASRPFSASAELGRLASSCSACSFWGFNTMCDSARYRRDHGQLPASRNQSHLATSSDHLQTPVHFQYQFSAFSRGGESRRMIEAPATIKTAPTSSMPIILMNKHKSGHFWISTKKWQKMMHALWGNTVTTTRKVGRPKAVAKALAKSSPPAGTMPPPTPPRGKAAKPAPKATVKKVSFAVSPSQAAPSGRARLEQLIGPSFYSEPFPATGLSKYVGEIAMAGHNLLQETQALATNLKDLGNGMKSGKFKSDMSDSELDWMDEFTKLLEEYISSLNKKVNASSASKPTLSPSVKSASPSAGSTLMDKFFPEESVEYAKTQAFEYKAPSDGDASTRHAAKFDSLLRDNATKNDYREWRLMSQAFVDTQAQLKILESSVRDSLLSSLGASTRQAVLAQFGSKLSSKKVVDLIHYLDMRHSFMASVEDTKIIEEFENCKRSTNMTLASFLATWKSCLTRASIAGYVPSSDVSNLLLSRAMITDAQTARVVEDLRSAEAADGVKLRGEARHRAVYDSLLKAAQVAEQVKLQRQTEKGPLFGKANANTAQVATADKKPRKRGRGRKTTVNAVSADAHDDPPPPQPPPKKTKVTTTAPLPDVQALTDAFTGAIHTAATAFAKKGGAKGSGKGKDGKGPHWQQAGGGKPKGAKKGGGKKGGKKGRKGKGKGGKGFDSRTPNQLPPTDWDQSKGAWRCSGCNAFNQHWKSWCSWCSKPKT